MRVQISTRDWLDQHSRMQASRQAYAFPPVHRRSHTQALTSITAPTSRPAWGTHHTSTHRKKNNLQYDPTGPLPGTLNCTTPLRLPLAFLPTPSRALHFLGIPVGPGQGPINSSQVPTSWRRTSSQSHVLRGVQISTFPCLLHVLYCQHSINQQELPRGQHGSTALGRLGLDSACTESPGSLRVHQGLLYWVPGVLPYTTFHRRLHLSIYSPQSQYVHEITQ